jgi:probable rRNA maturation factor
MEQVAREAHVSGSNVASLVIAGEQRMTTLNTTYRGKEGVTDILSFPSGESESGTMDWGDIILCPQYIDATFTKHGVSRKEHYTVLVIHGLLHLLGYDHHTNKEYVQMLTKELAVYKRVALRLRIPKERRDLDFIV